jgi:hypothetical protein
VSLRLESLKVLTRSGFPQDHADVHFELAVTRTCLSSLTNVDQRDEIARELRDRPRLLHPVVVPFPVDGNPIAANRHVGKLSRLNRCGALRYSRHLLRLAGASGRSGYEHFNTCECFRRPAARGPDRARRRPAYQGKHPLRAAGVTGPGRAETRRRLGGRARRSKGSGPQGEASTLILNCDFPDINFSRSLFVNVPKRRFRARRGYRWPRANRRR